MGYMDFETKRLVRIQKRLKEKVVLEDRFGRSGQFNNSTVAGVDLGYRRERAVCAAVVMDFTALEIIEKKTIETEVTFPYIPTFLAFREAPPILKVLDGLEFDIAIIDGQGIAHPRGIGIASHIGVLLDIPTIGVAKNRLCGEVNAVEKINAPEPIFLNRIKVGYAVKTKKNTNPIYISPGHRVSVDAALRIALGCIKDHKLPEPLRLAHDLANKFI